jgi:transposase
MATPVNLIWAWVAEEMRRHNWTYDEIALFFGAHKTTVRNWLNLIPSAEQRDSNRIIAHRLRASGHSYKMISRQLGISVGSAWNILNPMVKNEIRTYPIRTQTFRKIPQKTKQKNHQAGKTRQKAA